MTTRLVSLKIAAIFLVVLFVAGAAFAADSTAPATQPAGAKVLILTGMEHPAHRWQLTSPLLAKTIGQDPRLHVTICKDPAFLASPKLFDYDTIVLNYMNWKCPDPGDAARANLQKFVSDGRGLVLVHFACGAFQEWPEFKDIAGRVWDPKRRGHDPRGPFHVDIVSGDHPITRGMTGFEADDELYTCLTGDHIIEVLAEARSSVDGQVYPMAFVNRYGEGRVFECTLGHDTRALCIPEVGELYRRAAAWTAGLEATARK